MSEARVCPITGEPLPLTDPGRIVSQAACNRLRGATNDLAELMETIDEMIAGAGRKPAGGGSHVSGPRAPLNLGLLDAVSDWRDTIDLWASELLAYVRPGVRYRPGDWRTAEVIFQQYASRCSHWTQTWGDTVQETGAMCIDETIDAIRHLDRIANPRETLTQELSRDEAMAKLADVTLTIRSACETIRLLTGRELPTSTVRSWEHRGKITGQGSPKRYPISQLIQLADNI